MYCSLLYSYKRIVTLSIITATYFTLVTKISPLAMYRSILVTSISALYSKIKVYLYSLFAAMYSSVSILIEC